MPGLVIRGSVKMADRNGIRVEWLDDGLRGALEELGFSSVGRSLLECFASRDSDRVA